MCMKAVKISLELAIVPIRKFLIIFFIYMRLLFGQEVFSKTHPDAKENLDKDTQQKKEVDEKGGSILYMKEYAEKYLIGDDKDPARFVMRSENPVEHFYKRHMSLDHPIPQVIVVGILRVLLTTCPNNAKNAGGIDLHSEWSSCLYFLVANKGLFKEWDFKTPVFEKTEALLNDEPGAEEDDQDGDLEFAQMPEY